jgi:hypothetical protein
MLLDSANLYARLVPQNAAADLAKTSKVVLYWC